MNVIDGRWSPCVTFTATALGDMTDLAWYSNHPILHIRCIFSRLPKKEKAICDWSNGGCTNDAPVKQGVKFHYLKKLVVHKWLTQFCSSPTVVTQEKVQNEAWMQDVGVKFHS